MRSLIAVLLCVGASASPTLGQTEQSLDPFGFDFSRFLCEQSGLEPVTAIEAMRNPRDCVLLLFGRISEQHKLSVIGFGELGGAVLFATDHTANTTRFGTQAGPHIVRDPKLMYQGHADCFRVAVEDHEITRGVKEIIVNRSGSIPYGARRKWKVIARLPESGQPLLATYESGATRLVLMADHSPFTNDMLMHGDNAILAVNIINWLTKDNRRKVAFVVDGKNMLGSPMPPLLPPDDIPPIDPDDVPNNTKLAIANRFLKEVEKENALNRFLAALQVRKYRVFWRWIILIATVLMAFIFFRKLLNSRSIVRPPDLHAANASEARAATMLRTRSMRPAAQELARDLIRRLTGSGHDVTAWSISSGQVWVAPDVPGSARRVRADLEKLARLASGPDRRRMKPKELRRLATRIEELAVLHNNGQLRLQPVAATT